MGDSGGPRDPFEGFRIEIDPAQVEDAIRSVRDRLRDVRARLKDSLETGRYTKVRLRYKNKQIGPDIPLHVFLAGEGAVFLAMSPVMALAVNVGATAVFDVELVHESDELVAEGREFYSRGDLDDAEAAYRKALSFRPDDPSAQYHLGVLLRVSGRSDEALAMLRKAAMGPEGHPDVLRAAEALERMQGGGRRL